jgi:hypothetical protein
MKLAPVGVYVWDGTNRLTITASAGYGTVVFGQQESQRAMNQFKQLGDKLRPLETMLNDRTAPFDQEAFEAFKVSVQEFANCYGTLEGDHQPLTIDQWRKEIREFRDLWDVAATLRTGKRTGNYRETEERFRQDDAGLWYIVPRSSRLVVSRESYERLKSKVSETSNLVYAFEEARKGPRHRALVLFSRMMNTKLEGGFSLHTDIFEDSVPVIMPVTLKHALYAKLLIKTKKYEQDIRGTYCLNCDQPIVGTRRKKFCDDQCRAEFHNRRRAVLS